MNAREASRKEWKGKETWESINGGSLQRIADAVEKVAGRWDELTLERDRYLGWWKEEQARRQKLQRRIIALRGVITRMKRKAEAQRG